jgi:hypothetical protein
MKTSFRDIIETERYLRRELDQQETLLFEAKLLVSEQWRRNTYFHKLVHRLVHAVQRKKLRSEAEDVYERLFQNPMNASFSAEIKDLFKH